MKKTLVGTGILQWGRAERVSDRYGLIFLSQNPEGNSHVDLKNLKSQKGSLSVKITETRKSDHIGDLFRGFRPGGASKGDEVVLGDGTLFYEEVDGVTGVGVKPSDGRSSDWMNPEKLYYCHNQTVELFFAPESKKKTEKSTVKRKAVSKKKVSKKTK